jgi:hypothetical protein
MRLLTTTYTERVAKLPKSGRYIVAQFDAEGVILYQAYRLANCNCRKAVTDDIIAVIEWD